MFLARDAATILGTMARAHDTRIDGDPIAASRLTGLYHIDSPKKAARRCADPAAEDEQRLFSLTASSAASAATLPLPPPLRTPDPAVPIPRVRCTDGAARLAQGVRLVLGVHSAPNKFGRERRNGIRETWMRYPSVGRTVMACFIVGRRGVKPKHLRAMDEEQAQHADMVFLNDTVHTGGHPHLMMAGTRASMAAGAVRTWQLDGAGPFVTISKLHDWFRLVACELLPPPPPPSAAAAGGGGGARGSAALGTLATSVRHVAKVDDDTFLNLPLLQARLDSLWCHPHLYYGTTAYGGYRPGSFSKCGYDYSLRGGKYRMRVGGHLRTAWRGAKLTHDGEHSSIGTAARTRRTRSARRTRPSPSPTARSCW